MRAVATLATLSSFARLLALSLSLLSLSLTRSRSPSVLPGKLRQLDKFKEWLKREDLRLGIQAVVVP